MAAGIDTITALSIGLTWLVGFTATMVAVRGVIASQKRQSRTVLWTKLAFASLVAVSGWISGYEAMIAVTPMLVPSWYLMLVPPSSKHLRRVGWTLVVTILTTAIMAAFQF